MRRLARFVRTVLRRRYVVQVSGRLIVIRRRPRGFESRPVIRVPAGVVRRLTIVNWRTSLSEALRLPAIVAW